MRKRGTRGGTPAKRAAWARSGSLDANAVLDVLNAWARLDELPYKVSGVSVTHVSREDHQAALNLDGDMPCVDVRHLSQAFGHFRADVLVREYDAVRTVMNLRPAFHATF